MAINPASQTNDTAQIARAAAEAAAKAKFLALLEPLINDAAAKGETKLTVHTFAPMNLQDVATTLTDLGYKVAFIDSRRIRFQPSELFGQFWDEYWSTGGNVPDDVENPTRMKIGWKNT